MCDNNENYILNNDNKCIFKFSNNLLEINNISSIAKCTKM